MSDHPERDTIWAGLHLLDRQLIDKDGYCCGSVDDLELSEPDGTGGLPVVTAIYSGPGGLARRLGGRLGAWIESVHSRLHPKTDPGPSRVSFGVVKNVGSHIELIVSRDDLEIDLIEDWVRDMIISKIPGAQHEAD